MYVELHPVVGIQFGFEFIWEINCLVINLAFVSVFVFWGVERDE